jgi:hypothetical protein
MAGENSEPTPIANHALTRQVDSKFAASARAKSSPNAGELPLKSPVPGRKFHAGWGDMDMNGHMANTAYLDRAVDARMLTFRELGFPREEFVRLRLGVVVMRDEIEYRREVKLMEEIAITFLLAGWRWMRAASKS